MDTTLVRFDYFAADSEPSISVVMVPKCPKPKCQKVWTQMKDALERTIPTWYLARQPTKFVHPSCQVCHEVENVMRCSGCKVIAYCGKKHQKKDWKEHREVCALWAKQKDILGPWLRFDED